MRATRVVLALALALMAAGSIAAQTVAPGAVPEPYGQDEFPSWATGLRRFEIVSLGAFPVLLFYTRFGFDLKRFFDNGFKPEYAPRPIKNEKSYKASNDEQMSSVLTAAGLSLAFGAVDALIVWLSTLE